jgi:hypothetical protein
MRQILVKRGEVKALGELFNVSKPTVIHALFGRRSAPIHIKIREAALERGGVECKN